MNPLDAPPSVHDHQDALLPKGPWSFIRSAVPGGGSPWGLQLLASWLAFFLLSNVFWAIHLRSLAGWSSLPSYWGELLTVRDLWELVENGGLKNQWLGPLVPLASGLALLWFLWAGWRLQTLSVGLPARISAWFWGFLDALLIGAAPLALVLTVVLWFFGKLGASGIQGLSWLDWVGGTLARLSCLSAFFLQWWLCRLGRAAAPAGWRMGGWTTLGRHLADCFFQAWLHPVQWLSLILGGVVVRTGLTFLVLLLAWRWGGGTPLRVTVFLVLQMAVVVLNAWLLGWFLRLVAGFWRHDAAVRSVIRQLHAEAWGGGAGSKQ